MKNKFCADPVKCLQTQSALATAVADLTKALRFAKYQRQRAEKAERALAISKTKLQKMKWSLFWILRNSKKRKHTS